MVFRRLGGQAGRAVTELKPCHISLLAVREGIEECKTDRVNCGIESTMFLERLLTHVVHRHLQILLPSCYHFATISSEIGHSARKLICIETLYFHAVTS